VPNAEHPERIVARAERLTAIDRSFPTPLHAQFRYLLLGMIERGEVRPGIAMPSERDLAARYRVSLAPV
jgi:DNA-binding GntR family transcriptional regulator